MSIKYKDDILPMLAFCTSIFLSIAICETTIVCPNVSIESGSSRVISCQSDRAISNFYWYRGNFNSAPILILDNEGKGGSEYESEHFDISSNGSMILNNVLVEHESAYSFVGYDNNIKVGEAMFVVTVIIYPDPPCPQIHGCNSCIECDLFDLKKTGTLTCEIKGSRPLVPLVWNITYKKRIDFVRHHSNEERNLESDSWDTSVPLDYTIEDSCGVIGEVKCVAEDSSHILQSRITRVNIKTDPCKAMTPLPNVPVDVTSPSKTFSLLVVVLVIAIPVVLGIVFCIIFTYVWFTRRKRTNSATQLAISLTERYREFCYLKPLPWVKDIHIESLYVDSQCSVKDKTLTSEMSTRELKNERDIFREKLVIFKAEHGFGRTTFLKQVVQEWIKDTKTTRVLIYIPLKNSTRQTTLLDIVIGEMSEASRFAKTDIEKILKTKNCLLILDGLEDLQDLQDIRSSSTDEKELRGKRSKTTEIEALLEVDGDETGVTQINYNNELEICNTVKGNVERSEALLTLGELLKWQGNNDYKSLRVWVSSSEAAFDTVPWPKSYVEVKLTRFTDRQFQEYVEKCCKYYFNSKPGRHEATKNYYTVCNEVHGFLKENKIREIFEEAPLLVNMSVHILAAYYNSAVRYLEGKQIKDMDMLMRIVIDAMEARYKNKNKNMNSPYDDKDFSTLEEKLGKLAAGHKEKLIVMKRDIWVKKIGDEEVSIALQIGLLRFAKGRSSADNGSIEFYHQRIQDYLADHASG